MHGAGAGGELGEYESGGLGAGHGLVGVDERELLPELGCCKQMGFPYFQGYHIQFDLSTHQSGTSTSR